MKRRNFLKGAALATAVVSLPVMAKERLYSFSELFGPSPFPNQIYHSLQGPLLEGIIRPLEVAERFTDKCAGTHFGYGNPCLIEIKPRYTQAEVDDICQKALDYLNGYGFISQYGVGYALWFCDYMYKPGYLFLNHHGSTNGRRWQYGIEEKIIHKTAHK